MRVQEHLKLSSAAALALSPWLKKDVWVPFTASILIDVDHFIWYAVTHRSLNPREAVAFFGQADPPQTAGMKFFHQPWLLGLLALLALRTRSRWLWLILGGMLFHASLDVIHISQMRHLKTSLNEQAQYQCPQCGRYEYPLQLHTVYFAPNLLERYDPRHYIVLCPECHTQAHQPQPS